MDHQPLLYKVAFSAVSKIVIIKTFTLQKVFNYTYISLVKRNKILFISLLPPRKPHLPGGLTFTIKGRPLLFFKIILSYIVHLLNHSELLNLVLFPFPLQTLVRN